jgi:hypothetical protein
MTANTQTDTSALEALNFVGRDSGERLDLWRHGLQGDWETLCSAGRRFGREACDYVRATDNASLVPGIVRTIAERGSFGGVEVGFFTELSIQLKH